MNQQPSINHVLRAIIRQFLNEVADIVPYLLLFYVAVLILAALFLSWRQFFNWPILHGGVVIFCLLALGSERVRQWLQETKQSLVHSKPQLRPIVIDHGLVKQWFTKTKIMIHELPWYRWGGLLVRIRYYLYSVIRTIAMVAVHSGELVGQWVRYVGKYIAYTIWRLAIAFKVSWGRIWFFPWYKKVIIAGVIVAAIVMVQYRVDSASIFIFCYGLAAICLSWSARGAVVGCIAVLAICAAQVQLGKLELAAAVAVYAYYFLFVAVVITWRDAWRERAVA